METELMATEKKYIIRKQVLDLYLDDQRGAMARQRQINALFQEKVLPLLSQEFDDFALKNGTLRIPHLTIDLGNISPHELERVFVEKCVQGIRNAVFQSWKNVETGSPSSGEQLETEAQQYFNALFQFLAHGRLPTLVRQYPWQQLEKSWIEKVVLARKETFRNTLIELITDHPQVLVRLVQQFSFEFLSLLGPVLSASSEQLQQQINAFLELINPAIKSGRFSVRSARQWHLRFFQGLLLPQAGRTSSENMAALVAALKEDLKRSGAKPILEKARTSESERDFPDHFTEGIDFTNPEEGTKNSIDPGGDWIDLAGLILLHPFLPAFFRELKLIDRSTFRGPGQQQRAIFLLYFLATGNEGAGEHELLLPKILCGWPLNFPVEKEWQLTKLEKTEATELLLAVLSHWTALKSTSADGLRQAFLQRSGWLKFQAEKQQWTLQIERKGQDILLDKLPWGIGLISIPWLETRIVVEW